MERKSVDAGAEDSPPPSVPLSGPVLLPPGPSLATFDDSGAAAKAPVSWPAEPAWGGQIGRYVVLRAIGSGGMGVVLAAFDPDLERKVALKILHEGVRNGSASSLRMLREAQAMARLSHPNVAQVYEVAEDRGRLFLAMEYIAGTTLREWLNAAPRSWREALRVYVEAGRGLAAAHAAGLMHRDFKPDNAMLAADGRVRVLDFGLSRLHASAEASSERSGGALQLQVTVAGSLVGTPAYMSPEQFDRQDADARSDQFSFCVALWEALYGQRPFAGRTASEVEANVRRGLMLAPPEESEVPTWLRKVVERGLAVDPALRWPAMEELLAALTRDTGRGWWRWAAVAGVLAIAGASYGVAAYRAAVAQVCRGAADELVGVWDPQRRTAVEQALRATGASYAERAIETTTQHLDAYAERWVAVHTTACTSHQRGSSSAQLLDRQMACLRQRRSEFEATAAVLGQTTRETVAQAIDTARGLPSLTLCEDIGRLEAEVAPPDDPAIAVAVEAARGKLARLSALERSGRYAEALAAALPMVGEAERLGYLPLSAEVQLSIGRLYLDQMRPEGRAHFDAAMEIGLATKVDSVVAEALAKQVFQLGSIERRGEDALILAPLVWGFLRRLGDPANITALMHNNLGATYHELGQREAGIREYEAGLKLLDAHLPQDPLRWALIHNLALAFVETGRHAQAGELVRVWLGPLESEYGPCFPVTSGLLFVLGASEEGLGRPEAAVQAFETGLECFGTQNHIYTMGGLEDLGELYLQRGDLAQVRRQLERVEALLARSPKSRPTIDVQFLRVKLELAEGRLTVAGEALTELRGEAVATQGTTSDILMAIDLRMAVIAHRQGDDLRALDHLGRAEKSIGPGLLLGERGLYAFTLAQVLHALSREPERVATLVDDAIAAYTTAGAPYARNVAEVRAWQAAP